MAYEGVAREVVRGLKFRNRRAALGRLADAAADLVDEPVDLVTWVPAAPGHRRERGYDQAELLARRVAVRLRRPARRLLDRRSGPAQTGLGRARRLAGPDVGPRCATAGCVLVVDDVVTTGGSLAAAARALRSAGARRILGLGLAATPAPGGSAAG
jgi:predicted amidophosphoribosyltransferase